MLIDYHIHFEYGDYDEKWVKLFFEQAEKKGLKEIGITEHTHGFKEFKDLYFEDLILDNSKMGQFQKKWLNNPKTKFVHTLSEYVDFISMLKSKGYPVKLGLEVCNFRNQIEVRKILKKYEWDYLIVSIHFIKGWGFDFNTLKHKFSERNLTDIWKDYVYEIENVITDGFYDILGHPFNLRLFNNIPCKNDVEKLLEKTALLIKQENMTIDINTGTYYRYPVKEITPYADFMEYVKKYDIPVILSSDAHYPEHVGMEIKEAANYVKRFGIMEIATFNKRKRILEKI
ncbi:histidinol-phosphatase HisJ family protein [Leptotrichia sp. OH3620_COT-345]|uniref:histidinol-phosphatase HisJ family protein n=1 Tax=Leptotrichia sp. OH3620_COT-345 TaxID=2491048 RepID=UPI000F64D860|nr:histidinol-phosphatase HisJ family protein [Leptotrichia sp. OH3620_COT-345]RRD40991.1 histidinol-phosphatase HisJ family protein [Leptotrichia sp. OH3620_COT-345]